MKNFLATDRSKWIFIIVMVAIASGLTAKNVTSYPHECSPNKSLEVSLLGKHVG